MTPRPRMTPPEWAAANRRHKDESGHPGKRDPYLTPYMIPFVLTAHARTHKRVVMVTSAQSGKTETLLDLMGERLDSSPTPIIWVAPSYKAATEQFSPRIDELLTGTSLAALLGPKSRQRITRRLVNGVFLRIAHGGSTTAMKSDPYGLAITDEADELMSSLRGQGAPIGLIDARGDSYTDFVHVVTSTPSEGVCEVERDPKSGLEFWAEVDQKDIKSTIWKLWMSGTRYHWAWPCPHCGEYFIPRFSCLRWKKPVGPDGKDLPSTANLASKSAYLQCPNGCADQITDAHKESMNENGVYVAPGQSVTPDGIVHGLPPDSWTASYWASGLCSPFVEYGTRAARYVEAVRSGNPGDVQTVKNSQFGELWSPGTGAVPAWKEVQDCRLPDYVIGQVPGAVRVLTLTVDVQQNRLIYVVRGWGALGTSYLVDRGVLYGATDKQEIWSQLSSMITDPKAYGGIPLKLVLVDSGFRPGKKFVVPEHMVYAFARRHPHLVRATKGSSTPMRKPISISKIDIKLNGKDIKKGIELMRLDTDHFKSWVQQKVRWLQGSPGAWYLPEDIDEDYCRQIVSEARTVAPNGKIKWMQRNAENHFLDCEAMQAAAMTTLNLSKLRESSRQPRPAIPPQPHPQPDVPDPPPPPPPPPPKSRPAPRQGSVWGGKRKSIWNG